jgi:outer membrane receptor protein involved in Fe transport
LNLRHITVLWENAGMNITFARRDRSSLVVVFALISSIAFSAAVASSASAQSTQLSGVVRDASGAPIAGAQVELQTGTFSASIATGSSGTFVFDSVPAASGTLIVSAKDMRQFRQSWSSPAGAPVHLDVVLQVLSLSQSVMVTANRTATPLGETPASDIKLTQSNLEAIPALTLDDKLRQIPGFSLFRRSSSRTANPTTMGVSLRGLGASGSSRGLVLEDGVPLNDPFGSWVYWDRVPATAVQSVEIAQEGASSLYGSEAMAGVVQFFTRQPQPAGLTVDASYGNLNTQDLSLSAGGQAGKWFSAASGGAFRSDGFFLIPQEYRGSVDTQASSQHGDADLTVGRKLGANSDVFARGWYFDDSRNNGTLGQRNQIRLGEGALGANLDLGSLGTLTLRFYGEGETYFQNFYSVHFDQSSQYLTDSQTVPAQGVGGSAVWRRNLGHRQTLVAGFDMHEEMGHSHEIITGSTGSIFRETSAGGRQRTVGFFGEDLIQLSPGWLLNLSGRYDHWLNFDASYLCTPVTGACTEPNQLFPETSYDVFNPRATLLHQFNSHVSWSASVYRAFRAPTLNELYRGFRVGNVTTNPNASLTAERLTGGESGIDVTGFQRRFEVRAVYFYNQIVNPIANVPQNATTNQRENLGRISAPGVEIDAVGRITDDFSLSAGYQYVDSKIVSAPGQSALLDTWVEEVPHNTFSFQARYDRPSLFSATLDGRMIGQQLDTTGFYLGNYFALDATVSRRIAYGVQAYFAVENFTNQQYFVQALNPGVSPPQVGVPVSARIGFRYSFPRR